MMTLIILQPLVFSEPATASELRQGDGEPRAAPGGARGAATGRRRHRREWVSLFPRIPRFHRCNSQRQVYPYTPRQVRGKGTGVGCLGTMDTKCGKYQWYRLRFVHPCVCLHIDNCINLEVHVYELNTKSIVNTDVMKSFNKLPIPETNSHNHNFVFCVALD